MESKSADGRISFEVLRHRLIKSANTRIQNGDFTERGLARILGISQPQIHNILKGTRKLRPELADRLISVLEMTLLDLFEAAEIRNQLLRCSSRNGVQWNSASHAPETLKLWRDYSDEL